jgi:RNA 3'-terminal phosphate cyclase (ATP)
VRRIGSRSLTFRPGRLVAGDYSFDIGTAGSCTLVFQTVLPALLIADGESRVRIMGGTHNNAFATLRFPGAKFPATALAHGSECAARTGELWFYPRGGGEIRSHIVPATRLGCAGATRARRAGARIRLKLTLPRFLCTSRSANSRSSAGGWGLRTPICCLRALPNDVGPGNVVTITLEHEHVTEVFTGFGAKGVSAEAVAERARGGRTRISRGERARG